MTKTTHTFVVMAYEQSPHIKDCIESLKRQTLPSKIIITTSTPNSWIEAIAEEYQVLLKVNRNRVGLANDWSFAYDCADTQYVTLAHQDDIYLPDYTKYVLEKAHNSKDNLITFCKYKELTTDSECRSGLNLQIKNAILFPFFLFSSSLSSNVLKKILFAIGSPIACPSVMYNKSNIGKFSFSEEYSVNTDWKAWLHFANMKGSFAYVKSHLMKHRIYTGSETSRAIAQGLRQSEDLKLFKQVWPNFIAKPICKLYSLSYLFNR